MKSYRDHVLTGELDGPTAASMQAVRGSARIAARRLLTPISAADPVPYDAAAFGLLDVLAVKLVDWYGPADAADVLRHYAEVCANRPVKV